MQETRAEPFAQWLRQRQPELELALRQSCAGSSLRDAPETLRRAVEHAVLSGGKRLRPALVLLACEAAGGSAAAALPAAAAGELIHAYSLVHDDLPCMDDDQLRRGQPTIHVAFGEATAVLAGDALQALAFELLARQDDPVLARDQAALLAPAAGPAGMVGGQYLDLEAEGRPAGLAQVQAIHLAKTGALLAACFLMGARAAGRDPQPWSRYARLAGALFQATDDLLDATRSTAELGKTAGKDAASGKATLVAACGLQGAVRYAADLAEAALAALQEVPVQRHHRELADLPAFLLHRCR